MSTVLPSPVRAGTRMGVRVLFAGALAIGLLTSAPATNAHAATSKTPAHVKAPLAQQSARSTATRPGRPRDGDRHPPEG